MLWPGARLLLQTGLVSAAHAFEVAFGLAQPLLGSFTIQALCRLAVSGSAPAHFEHSGKVVLSPQVPLV